VQGLLFQDGGLLAMGFNIVNLGVLTCLVSYLIYQPLEYHRLAIALAAWASVVVAAAATALELAASGSIALGAVLPAMLAVHVFIGIGEALITLAVLAFLEETRPDLLMRSETTSAQGVLAGGLVLTLGIILLAPLTSSQPDGLERVAEDKGFLQLAHTPFYKILPDYTLPWIENPTLTMLVAGLIGMIVVWLVAYVIGKTRTASLKPK
jgi:cobalt/nickel transport system permease protein